MTSLIARVNSFSFETSGFFTSLSFCDFETRSSF